MGINGLASVKQSVCVFMSVAVISTPSVHQSVKVVSSGFTELFFLIVGQLLYVLMWILASLTI